MRTEAERRQGEQLQKALVPVTRTMLDIQTALSEMSTVGGMQWTRVLVAQSRKLREQATEFQRKAKKVESNVRRDVSHGIRQHQGKT